MPLHTLQHRGRYSLHGIACQLQDLFFSFSFSEIEASWATSSPLPVAPNRTRSYWRLCCSFLDGIPNSVNSVKSGNYKTDGGCIMTVFFSYERVLVGDLEGRGLGMGIR